MEHFKEIALDTADQKTAKWLKYVDAFMVWPRASKMAAISSPRQQPQIYHQIHNGCGR
jgi:hypothetical protein